MKEEIKNIEKILNKQSLDLANFKNRVEYNKLEDNGLMVKAYEGQVKETEIIIEALKLLKEKVGKEV